jgi:hypothetical protein
MVTYFKYVYIMHIHAEQENNKAKVTNFNFLWFTWAKGYVSSMYYSCNFSVSLKIVLNKTLKINMQSFAVINLEDILLSKYTETWYNVESQNFKLQESKCNTKNGGE